MGPKHENIEWKVDMDKQEEAGGTQVVGWTIAAVSQEGKEQAD